MIYLLQDYITQAYLAIRGVSVKVTKLIKKRDDSKRSYTVEYSGVIALAVQAIKEFSEQVSALEAYIGPENLTAMSKEPTS